MALLEARGLTIGFGGHNAVNEVDLDVERECVTGLIGPNGAGKTTTFNAITGLQEVSSGKIAFEGRDITREPPRERARMGIARTFQQLEVFGSLSVRENIVVAAEIRRRWAHDFGSEPERDAEIILDRVGLRAVADDRADTLPTGLARLCELGRALAVRPRLLLLDEPASGLSDHETAMLASLVRALAADGIAVLLVDHDVGLVMEVCDQVHVLDYGALIAVGTPAEIRHDGAVLDAYLGTTAAATKHEAPATTSSSPTPRSDPPPARDNPFDAPPVLALRNVSAAYGRIEVLHGVDLDVPAGMFVSLLGPNGAGKSTALKVASGQMTPTRGCVHLGGRHVNGSPSDAFARIGLCTIPEGRGVFTSLTVRENLVMATYAGVPQAQIEERAYTLFPRLAERRSQPAGTLSGGEQRMLAMARALATEPAVLLLDELSMGLAPLVVEELYGIVADIARAGVSILAVEQFAHIVLAIADVAAVMVQGRITAVGRPSDIEAELSSAYLGANL